MREILFRGKAKDGRWVYGNLIRVGEYCCILEPEECVHPADYPYLDKDLGVIDGKATPVDPKTVGQYTGLTDIHGTKIFEGDIIKCTITYDIGCYPRENVIIKAVQYRNGLFTSFQAARKDLYEIQGNIYETPRII